MSVTESYSHTHEAFEAVGRANDLQPFHMRVLVALEERGGVGRTDELEVELQCEGSAVRRAYPVLAERGYIFADAGEGTLRPKRGMRSRLVLRDNGRQLAWQALRRAEL